MKSNLSARERSGDRRRRDDARPTRTLGRGLRAVAVRGVLFLVRGPVAAGDSLGAHSAEAAKPVLGEVEPRLGTGSTSDASGGSQNQMPRDPRTTNHSPVTPRNDRTPHPAPGRNTGRAKTGSASKPGGDTRTGAGQANASNAATTGADVSDLPSDIRPLPRTSPSHAIGRWNPPSEDEPGANQTFVPNPPAGRTTTNAGAARSAIARIADALRFPTVLLALLVVFLALQQRADRGDPKLAQAPVRGCHDWLEFR